MKKVAVLLTAASMFLMMNTAKAATQDGWYKNGENWEYYQNNVMQRNKWAKINHQWYHFDDNGMMQTGWYKENGLWYYLGKDGDMKTGWFVGNYEGSDSYYYANQDGVMQTGWIKDETNRWYSLREDGTLRIHWYHDGTNWYYLGHDGDMKTGWWPINEQAVLWSYFNPDGTMVSDQAVRGKDGYLYMIGKDCYMVTDMNGIYTDAKGNQYRITYWNRLVTGWYLQSTLLTDSKYGPYDLLEEVVDHQEGNRDIDPQQVVKNIQHFKNRQYFNEEGIQQANLPKEMTVHSNIVFKNGKPYREDTSMQLSILGKYTIINNELYIVKNQWTGELKPGYDIVYGSGPETGYNILTYADANGKVLKMRRLSKNPAELPHKEVIDGLNNDRIYIDYDHVDHEVMVVK